MAQWHGYIGIENLALNAAQREVLVNELKALGPASDPQPARLCHWRTRLDGEAIILEALFNEANLTIARFKQRLATIFNVAEGDIAHSAQTVSFAGGVTNVVDFAHNAVDRLRFALFGGHGAVWMESGDECRGYLAANCDEWDLPQG